MGLVVGLEGARVVTRRGVPDRPARAVDLVVRDRGASDRGEAKGEEQAELHLVHRARGALAAEVAETGVRRDVVRGLASRETTTAHCEMCVCGFRSAGQ